MFVRFTFGAGAMNDEMAQIAEVTDGLPRRVLPKVVNTHFREVQPCRFQATPANVGGLKRRLFLRTSTLD
jgi:hypothetical protein